MPLPEASSLMEIGPKKSNLAKAEEKDFKRASVNRLRDLYIFITYMGWGEEGGNEKRKRKGWGRKEKGGKIRKKRKEGGRWRDRGRSEEGGREGGRKDVALLLVLGI